MAAKTPISQLQEIAMKLKIPIPEYEIVFSRVEGMDPKFTYQCNFNGKEAEGSGRTKKDAKHLAAGNLLKLLQEESQTHATILSAVSTPVCLPPHNSTLQTNYVGELAYLCLERLNFTEKPLYEEVAASGAAHLPTFTIRCKVSNFKTEAMGPTKKQAKQLAAKYMLERLQQLDNIEEPHLLVALQQLKICTSASQLSPARQESLTDLSEMDSQEKEIIRKVLALHRPSKPKLENMNDTNKIFKQLYPPPEALINYPVDAGKIGWSAYNRLKKVCDELGEDMLSLYKFEKSLYLSNCDDSKVQNLDDSFDLDESEYSFDGDTSMNIDIKVGQVYYSCLATVHVRPMNLHCMGVGEDLQQCISAAANRMLFLLYCFFFDSAPLIA